MRDLLGTVAGAVGLSSLLERLAHARRMRRQRRRFLRWSEDDQLRMEFYRQFVASGETVFDVGANLGNRAKVFARLGAEVVAVEPQQMCGDFLASVFGQRPDFHLVRCALGSSVGEADMMVSEAHTISSLSPDWVRTVKESHRFGSHEWTGTQHVKIDTLDNLIARFGIPAFIKIDVEGFEAEVVAGLSHPVRSLSMEFIPEFQAGIESCLDHLDGIGDYVFQISLGETMDLHLPKWVGAADMKSELRNLPPGVFGDTYAALAESVANR